MLSGGTKWGRSNYDIEQTMIKKKKILKANMRNCWQ